MDAIVVRDLARAFGSTWAVDGISFSVAPGEIFALLGPNGTGETTTWRSLRYRSRDGGEVRILGFDPAIGGRATGSGSGIVLQSAGFEEEFTVRDLVRLQASSYPRRHDVGELIDLVELTDKADVRVRPSPAANAGGSTWRSGWSARPRCCSWTNRRPGSTPRPGTEPGSSLRGCAADVPDLAGRLHVDGGRAAVTGSGAATDARPERRSGVSPEQYGKTVGI